MISKEEAEELCREWQLCREWLTGVPWSRPLTMDQVCKWLRAAHTQHMSDPDRFTPLLNKLLCIAQYVHYRGPIDDRREE